MKLSLFTPTHDFKNLEDTLASLKDAAEHAPAVVWEWVIVPNGEKRNDELPAAVRTHENVRVVKGPEDHKGIGHLKKFACEHCTGTHFVELDHDDMLTPTAFANIAAAIVNNPQAGFLYSDNVGFYENGASNRFSSNYGWEQYQVEFRGKPYTAMRAFPPTPASLHLIYYAPDHVRIWSREAYEDVGGHDENMAVGDDHDLICRTYLAGHQFIHIAECTYMYRLHDFGKNTFLVQNDDVQTAQQEVSNRYTHQLVAEWCRRESFPMIDLGGAHGCPDGFQSVDLHDADFCVDIMRDGLPFEDNSVGCVRASDFLEHIPTCASRCDHGKAAKQMRDDQQCAHGDTVPCVVAMMNEIYRVLVPGGWLLSKTPSSDGRGAFQDPTHVSFWNPNSFWYYTRRTQAQYVPGIECRFAAAGSGHVPRIWQGFPSRWHQDNQIPYVFADLIAIKDQRHPGEITI